jgi:hypothetical protein
MLRYARKLQCYVHGEPWSTVWESMQRYQIWKAISKVQGLKPSAMPAPLSQRWMRRYQRQIVSAIPTKDLLRCSECERQERTRAYRRNPAMSRIHRRRSRAGTLSPTPPIGGGCRTDIYDPGARL